MIKSMTAYAQCEVKNIHAYWELRSVNQRYLEISIHVPENFRYLEKIIREHLNKYIKRGKIDCYLKFNSNDNTNLLTQISINNKLLNNVIETLSKIEQNINKKYITMLNLFDIINYPGIIIRKVDYDKNYQNNILNELILSLDKTIFIFLKNREKEGNKIKLIIKKNLEDISKKIKILYQNIPNILELQKKRIIEKIKKLQTKIENNRLEQEIVFILQKLDVAEEINRLKFHIEEIFNTLNSNEEPIGKKIDFILQELNRESNTLSSKSTNVEMTSLAIEIKVLIEQIREQVQNIE